MNDGANVLDVLRPAGQDFRDHEIFGADYWNRHAANVYGNHPLQKILLQARAGDDDVERQARSGGLTRPRSSERRIWKARSFRRSSAVGQSSRSALTWRRNSSPKFNASAGVIRDFCPAHQRRLSAATAFQSRRTKAVRSSLRTTRE